MSTTYTRKGSNFLVSSNLDTAERTPKLPAGNYIVQFDPMTVGFFLELVDSFVPLAKTYGDTLKHADRIINTFLDRPSSTGVMLAGEKGSGKSLLAKTLSIECAKKDIPTIIINSPYKGDQFNRFLQLIEEPCVILFDEFEKVYDKEDQEAILTLLDGVFPSKKLFVLTCNDVFRIDKHMYNRPGRIFYMIEFKGIDIAFLKDYCQDRLDNKEHINGVINVSYMFKNFNFDMLKALVEEMNRYKETAREAMTLLNAIPGFSEQHTFDVTVLKNGQPLSEGYISMNPTWEGNPFNMAAADLERDEYGDRNSTDILNIDLRYPNPNYVEVPASEVQKPEVRTRLIAAAEAAMKGAVDTTSRHLNIRRKFTSENLVGVDTENGVFTFKDDSEYSAILTRQVPKYYGYAAY